MTRLRSPRGRPANRRNRLAVAGLLLLLPLSTVSAQEPAPAAEPVRPLAGTAPPATAPLPVPPAPLAPAAPAATAVPAEQPASPPHAAMPAPAAPAAPAALPAPVDAMDPSDKAAPSVAVPSAPPTAPHLMRFDPVAMMEQAAPVVQGVVALLLLASLTSWTILCAKSVELAFKGRALRRAQQTLRGARSLADTRTVTDPLVRRLIAEAEDETARSSDMVRIGMVQGLQDRAASRLRRLEEEAERRTSLGLNMLASIGSIAPFIGLFGTVWGIMGSFIGIAAANTTSLAIVAPGIAEALLATALGLVAAIPATLMYNALGKAIGTYRARIEDAVSQVLCLVGRDAERAQVPVRRMPFAGGL